jgi:hypothetical protein
LLLDEYSDNPILTEELSVAFNRHLMGSSYIAWTLAKTGSQSFIPDALSCALQVADKPIHGDSTESELIDLQGAVSLILKYGSDNQVQQLAGLVWKYRMSDPNFLDRLLAASANADDARAVRVAAVLLKDKSIARGQIRFLRFSGFGYRERDETEVWRCGQHVERARREGYESDGVAQFTKDFVLTRVRHFRGPR